MRYSALSLSEVVHNGMSTELERYRPFASTFRPTISRHSNFCRPCFVGNDFYWWQIPEFCWLKGHKPKLNRNITFKFHVEITSACVLCSHLVVLDCLLWRNNRAHNFIHRLARRFIVYNVFTPTRNAWGVSIHRSYKENTKACMSSKICTWN